MVSAVLVGTLVSPAAAATTEGVVPSPLDVPPLLSQPVEPPTSAPLTSSFDEIDLLGSAPERNLMGHVRVLSPDPASHMWEGAGFDARSSVLKARSEFNDTYINADGTHTLATSPDPINAEDKSGSWVPIDTHLEQSAQGDWTTDAHPLRPSFAPRGRQ